MPLSPEDQLFGRRMFVGTGFLPDYFSPAPTLDYLRDGSRPDYVPPDAPYNPSLDAPALVQQGVPMNVAMQAQEMRARLHARSYEKRMRNQGYAAVDALSQVDPSRESFAHDLLDIFRQYPDSDMDPRFMHKVQTIQQLQRSMPMKVQEKFFDPDGIEDPDLYQQAVAEGWDKLPEKAGKRRMYDASSRKEKRMKLIAAGLQPEAIDLLEKEGGGYLSEERLANALQTMKAYAKPERTMTPEAANKMAQLLGEAREAEYAASMLEPESEEARLAMATAQNKMYQAQVYSQLLGITPAEAAAFQPPSSPLPEMAAAAPEAVGGVIPVTSQEQYDSLPSGSYYADSSGTVRRKK